MALWRRKGKGGEERGQVTNENENVLYRNALRAQRRGKGA